MTDPFTIMCFSWNASGLRLCETMSQSKADEARIGFKAFLTRKQPCIAPDFFEEIRASINLRKPSIVVMTTQDESNNGTYFHSNLLPLSMPEIGYSFLKRDKLSGIGESASDVPYQIVPSGRPSGSALRISIYVKNNIVNEFHSSESFLSNFFGNNGQTDAICDQGDRVSGAIASYVNHYIYGKFAFVALHLPAGMSSLKVGKDLDYLSYRAASKATNSLCLLKLYNQLISSLSPESRPDHIFLLGDFNYDIVIPGKKNIEIISELTANISAPKLKDLQRYDELKRAMEDVPLLGFKEGVSAEGPLFLPTWRLARGRTDTCSPPPNVTTISPTCFGDPNEELGGIGWHDRILYKELMTSTYLAHCTDYNRIDVKNMHASLHAGVIGFFEMRSIR